MLITTQQTNDESHPDLGEVVPHDDPDSVQLDIYRYVLDDKGEKTGTIRCVEQRLLHDVFKDVYARLNVKWCPKCGHEVPMNDDYDQPCSQAECDGEYEQYIDEYFSYSGPDDYDKEKTARADFWRIACFAVTGGSEGHYVHVEGIGNRKGTRNEIKTWFLFKTFRGWDFAWDVAKRLAMLLGV